MDEKRLRIAWMQSIMRLHSVSSPSVWADEETVSAFAALPQSIQYIPYEQWLQNMGLDKVVQEQRDATNAESALNVIRATAPNVSVEEQK